MRQFKFKSAVSLVGALSMTYSTAMYAGGVEISTGTRGPFLSFLGGANWISSSQSATSNFGGLTTNLYQVNSSSVAGPFLGVDAGYLWQVAHRYYLLTGVETSYTVAKAPYGIVYPLYLLGNFDTLNFNYQLSSVPLFGLIAFGTKFGLFAPYVFGGLGVSWNTAENYNEVATNPDGSALPMRSMFGSNTGADFAWTVGAGTVLQIASHSAIRIEYRYTDYGVVCLSPTSTQSASQKLKLGAITSNALLIGLTVAWV